MENNKEKKLDRKRWLHLAIWGGFLTVVGVGAFLGVMVQKNNNKNNVKPEAPVAPETREAILDRLNAMDEKEAESFNKFLDSIVAQESTEAKIKSLKDSDSPKTLKAVYASFKDQVKKDLEDAYTFEMEVADKEIKGSKDETERQKRTKAKEDLDLNLKWLKDDLYNFVFSSIEDKTDFSKDERTKAKFVEESVKSAFSTPENIGYTIDKIVLGMAKSKIDESAHEILKEVWENTTGTTQEEKETNYFSNPKVIKIEEAAGQTIDLLPNFVKVINELDPSKNVSLDENTQLFLELRKYFDLRNQFRVKFNEANTENTSEVQEAEFNKLAKELKEMREMLQQNASKMKLADLFGEIFDSFVLLMEAEQEEFNQWKQKYLANRDQYPNCIFEARWILENFGENHIAFASKIAKAEVEEPAPAPTETTTTTTA